MTGAMRLPRRSATSGTTVSSVVPNASAAWRTLAGAWPSERQPCGSFSKNSAFSRDW